MTTAGGKPGPRAEPAPFVRITDVGPRDGLQNEAAIIPTLDKARLVGLLADAGVDEVEVSSFVSPRWVPQLADAAELFQRLADAKPQRLCFSALVPNEKGMHAALEVNARAGRRLIDKVAVFTAASESFSRRNTNASIAQTLERFRPVVALAHDAGLLVRGYISCAVHCPFEGAVAPDKPAVIAERLCELGIDELDLGDTIGMATPRTTDRMIEAVLRRVGEAWRERTTLHLHDTFGGAVENVRTALQLGIRSFDGAAGGLGGCPYASTPAKRAPGNLATETLVRAIHDQGLSTHVDPQRLAVAAAAARALVAGKSCATS